MTPEHVAALKHHILALHEAAMDATLPPARRRWSRLAARSTADAAKHALDGLLDAPVRLPPGPIRLDFEIHPGEPGAEAEWDRRARWIAHLRAHVEELVSIALDRTRGDPFEERTKLAVERLGALLTDGRTALGDAEPPRLDLASPLPALTPWPDRFAGEPLPSSMRQILSRPLDWTHLPSLRLWARLVAYHVTGLRPEAPPAVADLARKRLAQLLDAGRRGLESTARR